VTLLSNLENAQDEIARRAQAIRTDEWLLATPCEGWNVRDLVVHIVEGSGMATRLLRDGSGGGVRSGMGDPHPDLTIELAWAFSEEARAFADDGALVMTVRHPRAGEISGATFCVMRTADYLIHSWDVARATGGDEQLPDDLVRATWEGLQPLASIIGQVGVFGSGPSGTLRDDAPLQLRLLDLSGRRP